MCINIKIICSMCGEVHKHHYTIIYEDETLKGALRLVRKAKADGWLCTDSRVLCPKCLNKNATEEENNER